MSDSTTGDSFFVRQPIAIVKDADVASDAVQKLLDVLTAARVARASLAAHIGNGISSYQALVTIWASTHPDAEYAMRLYASALADEGVTLEPHVSKYSDGTQIRTLQMSDRNGRIADIQWPQEKQPIEGDASTAWSPSQQERQ